MKTKFILAIAGKVAQIFNLPYSRFAICQPTKFRALANCQPVPNAIRRYGRLKICATAAVFAALIVLSSGCGRSMALQEQPVPAVTVAPAQSKEIVEWDQFTGRI